MRRRDYGNDYATIPPHGRWRHFLAGGVDRITPLRAAWTAAGVTALEQTRRMVDLTVVSVLLDAGAGNAWRYTDPDGNAIGRSEGLGVASLAAFESGLFSSMPEQPHRVDGACPALARAHGCRYRTAEGLAETTFEQIADAMQVSAANPMPGIEGRASLLIRLGKVLASQSYFASDDGSAPRPGNLVDRLLRNGRGHDIPLEELWEILILGLKDVWPSTPERRLGDVWPCPSIDQLVPFHKLTQWLCYSIVEVCVSPPPAHVVRLKPDVRRLEAVLGVEVLHKDLQTGLPEYRNGKRVPQCDDAR
jgi:hypothetical protein